MYSSRTVFLVFGVGLGDFWRPVLRPWVWPPAMKYSEIGYPRPEDSQWLNNGPIVESQIALQSKITGKYRRKSFFGIICCQKLLWFSHHNQQQCFAEKLFCNDVMITSQPCPWFLALALILSVESCYPQQVCLWRCSGKIVMSLASKVVC